MAEEKDTTAKKTDATAPAAQPANANAAQSAPASATADAPAADTTAQAAQQTQLAQLEEKAAAAKKEAADNYDRYVRSVADLENFRRRTLREKDELRQYAAGRVLEDMFPVIEAIALGLDHAKKPGTDVAHVVEGMNMVLNQLKTTLANHGLKEINPAIAEKFDPHQEDAIATQPSDEVPDGHVLQVFRVGYALNGRVLRPAAVIVSSGKAQNTAK